MTENSEEAPATDRGPSNRYQAGTHGKAPVPEEASEREARLAQMRADFRREQDARKAPMLKDAQAENRKIDAEARRRLELVKAVEEGRAPDSPEAKSARRYLRARERYSREVSQELVPLVNGADRWARLAVGRGKLADVFRRGGGLVSIVVEGEDGYVEPDNEDDSNGPSQVVPLTAAGLHARMVYRHTFTRGDRETVLPLQVATHAVAAPELLPNVRDLAGVTDFPLVCPDGSLMTTPGYDEESRLYYLPRPGAEGIVVPEHPTRADVARARYELEYLIQDFPFATLDDRANYLGMLITPAVRLLVPGRSKGCILDAPDAGSGKTLLAHILMDMYGGVMRSSWPKEEELGKELGTIFDTTSSPVVVFDNVRGNLKSATAEALLTSRDFSIRRLGSSTEISARNDRLWIWTANNLAIGGDMARRVLRVTINADMPKPHLRPASQFSEPDLRGYVRAHRDELLSAVLTLVRAWVLAGRPGVGDDAADEFSSWRSTVAGVLAHAGIGGEFDSKATRAVAESDDDSEWGTFLAYLYDRWGSEPWKANRVIALAQGEVDREWLPDELLSKFRLGQDGTSATKSLGRWLAYRENRWASGYAARRVPQSANESRKNGVLWFIEKRGE